MAGFSSPIFVSFVISDTVRFLAAFCLFAWVATTFDEALVAITFYEGFASTFFLSEVVAGLLLATDFALFWFLVNPGICYFLIWLITSLIFVAIMINQSQIYNLWL